MTQRYRSGIFWHFTGSPSGVDWSRVRKPADILKQGKPKPANEAVGILLKILESKKLLGVCVEQIAESKNTEPFCCVTDIPLKDLIYHSKYYGNVAVGFSSRVIFEQFLPVIYVPVAKLPASKEFTKPNEWCLAESEFHYHAGDTAKAWEMEEMAYVYGERVITELDESKAGQFFVDFLKITEFSSKGEDTFYSEREWRHIGDFKFNPHDVEMIIAPKIQLPRIRKYIESNQEYKRNGALSLISWEAAKNA